MGCFGYLFGGVGGRGGACLSLQVLQELGRIYLARPAPLRGPADLKASPLPPAPLHIVDGYMQCLWHVKRQFGSSCGLFLDHRSLLQHLCGLSKSICGVLHNHRQLLHSPCRAAIQALQALMQPLWSVMQPRWAILRP